MNMTCTDQKSSGVVSFVFARAWLFGLLGRGVGLASGSVPKQVRVSGVWNVGLVWFQVDSSSSTDAVRINRFFLTFLSAGHTGDFL